ncbi:hypothetical protein MHBO_001982, partial [Bonamia ostreae]
MNEKTHLLFRMFEVKKKSKNNLKELIGFAFLRLVNKEENTINFIGDGIYELTFFNEKLTKDYLNKTKTKPKFDMFSMHSSKNTMSVRIKLQSSILSNDKNLNALFSENNNFSLNDRLKNVRKMKHSNLVRFLAPLLKLHISYLANSEKRTKVTGLKFVTQMLKKLGENNSNLKYNDEELRKIWIYFYFKNFDDEPYYFHIISAGNYLFEINRKIDVEATSMSNLSRFSNVDKIDEATLLFLETLCFWFDCTLKSLQLEYNENKQIRKKEIFLSEFKLFVNNLFEEFIKYSSASTIALFKTIVKKVVQFTIGCYAMFSIDEIFDIVKMSVEKLSSEDEINIIELKKEFLFHFYDNDFFPQIILSEQNFANIDQIEQIYPLNALLINHCIANLLQKPPHYYFISVLTALFTKHDFDNRLVGNHENMAKVANSYLPLVFKLCSQPMQFEKNNSAERDVLVCFLWVLKNCDRKLLKEWWSKSDNSVVANFLAVLKESLYKFRYIGKDRENSDFKSFLSQETTKNFNVGKKEGESEIKSNLESMVNTKYSSVENIDDEKSKNGKELIRKNHSSPKNKILNPP